MTSLITSPRQEFSKKLPALPVIEHPSSRRTDDNNVDLQIRGSSREENSSALQESHGPLPPLKRRTRQRVSQGHSRVLTWPIGGTGKNSGGGSAGETPLHKRTPEELEELIREKMVTRINGLRQAFRSNDPMGKGNVSREALVTILYHLCGYLTTEQINGLLKRLGLDTQSTISFESFVSHFQDNESLTKAWVDPVVRPTVYAANFTNLPANRLRQKQRELALEQKHAALKKGRKNTPPKFYSALETFPQLKLRAQQGKLSYKKIFPPSCFDVDGMVLKPQLRTALQVLGFQMYEEEFDKVWDRFDRTGLGAVDSMTFFKTLGISPFYGHDKRVKPLPSFKANVEEKKQTVPTENETVPGQEEAKPPSPPKDKKDSDVLETEQDNSLENVMRLFSEKFKEGYSQVLNSFGKYDPEDTGQITRADFRKALSEYHLQLGPVEAEHFLQRCGMREQSMVPYKKLMDLYLDRSEQGRLQAILNDPKHRFNYSRDSNIGNTTAIDAEARLLDLLQSDFLALLGAFKQLDRDNLGVIKRYQFKDLLETRFNMKIKDDELNSVVQPLVEGSMQSLIPYGRFLELFTSSGENRNDASNVKMTSPPRVNSRPATSPKELSSPRRPTPRKELERGATQQERIKSPPRSANALFCVIRDLLTEKFQVIHKTFQGMDQLKKGYLSKGVFRRLFERYDLKFTSSEVDLLWSKLPSEKDGSVSFEELVHHCFLNYNVTSNEGGNGQTGSLSYVLQEYAKSVMHKRLASVPEEKEDDPEPLPTPPSQMQLEDQPGSPLDENASLPTLKTRNKPTVEATLRRIKPQVCSQWNELRDAFIAEDNEGSATLDFNRFKDVLRKFSKDVSEEEFQSLCLKFDRRKNSRVWYLEFMKYFLPTMAVKPQSLVPMSPSHRSRTQVAWTDTRKAREAIDAVFGKIRNQMISEWKGLRRAFKRMDLSGDGFVSVTDFKAAMNKFQFSLHEEDFFHIFSVFDENMAGRISYEEFMRCSLSV
ncbi:hypothetical protein ABFA07_012094 [Porites harrisoni]